MRDLQEERRKNAEEREKLVREMAETRAKLEAILEIATERTDSSCP